MCPVEKSSLPHSVRQWGTIEQLQQKYEQCLKECASSHAQEDVPNNIICAPKLADFLVHLLRVRLVWHVNKYLSFCYFSPFGTSS